MGLPLDNSRRDGGEGGMTGLLIIIEKWREKESRGWTSPSIIVTGVGVGESLWFWNP